MTIVSRIVRIEIDFSLLFFVVKPSHNDEFISLPHFFPSSFSSFSSSRSLLFSTDCYFSNMWVRCPNGMEQIDNNPIERTNLYSLKIADFLHVDRIALNTSKIAFLNLIYSNSKNLADRIHH